MLAKGAMPVLLSFLLFLRRHQARQGLGLRQGSGSNPGEAEMIVAEIDVLQ